ncbi:MAG: cyclic nucleotide-binding domain-containing protein [Alphaproteobacteria bacterium]
MTNATILANSRAPAVSWAAFDGAPQHGGESGDFEPLRKIGAISSFARNETIYSEGDSAEYSYKVVSGAVRLCKVLPDGRRQIAFFFLPGDFFALGEAAEHSFTAEAVSDVTAVCYPRWRIQGLCEQSPIVRKEMFSRLYRDLSYAQQHVVMLGRQSAKERVSSFLMILVRRANARDGDVVELPMGRQDIADYLGLTIETVCRALSDLKRSRLITTPTTHQVIVHSIAALQAVCEPDN